MSDVDPDSADASEAQPAEPQSTAKQTKTSTKQQQSAATKTRTSTKQKQSAKKQSAKKQPAKKQPAKKHPDGAAKKQPAKKSKPTTATVPTPDSEEPTTTEELGTVPAPSEPPTETVAPAEDAGRDPIDGEAADSEVPAEHPSRIDQVKALAAAVEARGQQTYEHLEAQRAESRTIDSVFVAAEHDEKIGGGILAGAVAFRLFLFLVPLVFVVVVGFGLGADAAGRSTRDAAESAGAAGLLARSMANVADGSVGSRLTAFVIGSFALWLTSRSALKVLRVASGLTWGVPAPKLPRPTRAAGIFILIVLASVVLVQLIGAVRDASLLIGLIATLGFVLVPSGLWLFVSLRGLPHAEGAGWRAMVPGSVLFGVGTELLHLFTVFWIARQVESKSETYGAIGVALALLFWAYLLGRVITAGMTLNASLWYRDHPRSDEAVPRQAIQPIKEQ